MRRIVQWQAHRGGGAHEAPDNTMAANRYAWSLGGIPEADLRTTSDGVIICLHDHTLERTTVAPKEIAAMPVSELTLAQVQAWDAGVKFDAERFAGERVPALAEAFAEMRGRPERMMYLDLKQVDLQQLGLLIDEYEVNGQVIFTHNVQENCRRMKSIAANVRSMLWIGGNAEQIRAKFEAARQTGFDGLDQVQFHLHDAEEPRGAWRYALTPDFLRYALEAAAARGIELEVLPFVFDEPSIHQLLELGIRWFATDEPAKFVSCVESWR